MPKSLRIPRKTNGVDIVYPIGYNGGMANSGITNRSVAVAKPSKRIVWTNYAREAWAGTRDGEVLCRIRRGPRSSKWMLLKCVGGAGRGHVSEWHSDYESLGEAKSAAAKQ